MGIPRSLDFALQSVNVVLDVDEFLEITVVEDRIFEDLISKCRMAADLLWPLGPFDVFSRLPTLLA